jgi:hypothetical protein
MMNDVDEGLINKGGRAAPAAAHEWSLCEL